MSDAFYENLCKRLSAPDGHILTYDDVMQWPAGKLDELVQQGKIKEVSPAETVECIECPDRCMIEPDVRRHPETGELFGVYCCPNKDDIGRITVDLERKRRWQIVPERQAGPIKDYDTHEQAFQQDWTQYNLYKKEVCEAIERASLAELIGIVIKDLNYWAVGIKRHMLKLMKLYEAGNTGFLHNGLVPYWFGREIVGMHETFEMLEFHKSVDYAKAFASKFDSFLLERKRFVDLAISYRGTATGSDYLEFWVAVDEQRKTLKARAFSLIEYLQLLQQQCSQSDGSAENDAELTTMLVKWHDDTPEYIPNADAVKLTEGKLTLAALSKILKPGGSIRYMRKGQRCKVHVQDFRKHVKTLHEEITDEAIDKYMQGVEARKKQIKQKKQR